MHGMRELGESAQKSTRLGSLRSSSPTKALRRCRKRSYAYAALFSLRRRRIDSRRLSLLGRAGFVLVPGRVLGFPQALRPMGSNRTRLKPSSRFNVADFRTSKLVRRPSRLVDTTSVGQDGTSILIWPVRSRNSSAKIRARSKLGSPFVRVSSSAFIRVL